MKQTKKSNHLHNRISLILKYTLLSIGVFVFSVIISMTTRAILVNDSSSFGFTENQASLIAGMLDAIVGALSAGLVVYQLKAGDIVEERQSDIEEAKFILEYNQSFIQDEKMSAVEQLLEQDMLRLQNNKESGKALITDENRQQFINYLVYLEGLAPLILRGVLQLEHIDDLMAYRFFLAMNNPTLQEDQLKVFPEYYRGCFKLYDMWKQYRLENGKEIMNSQYSIDRWEYYREFASDICIRGVLPSDDKKSIAELIYGTDPYIYPAAFGNIRSGKKHIADFLDIENNPYQKDNIKVAVKNGEIVGIIAAIHSRPIGEYRFERYAADHPELPKHYLHTAKHYFNTLYDYWESKNDVYISCVCVKEDYRGQHIGEMMLMNLIRNCKDKNIHLHVLCANSGAIHLYERCGFRITDEAPGYSVSEEKPECFEMTLTQLPEKSNEAAKKNLTAQSKTKRSTYV